MIVNTLKTYYHITKPGIIRGNLLTSTAGFLLASKRDIDFLLLFFTLAGIALVIASGCVFNNYIDREIDSKMDRTKNRAIVTGKVTGQQALIFATILGILGLTILTAYTNYLTALIGLAGLFFYVVVYGYFKRTSEYGTLVGSISGAMPPAAGYVAVTGAFDTTALLLFLVLTAWQMPHFYAIAIFRKKDYAAASIPVLPITRGDNITRIHIISYIILFIISSLSLPLFGQTGITYSVVILIVSGWWLYLGLRRDKKTNINSWAKKIFGSSLVVLLTFSFLISINSFVP